MKIGGITVRSIERTSRFSTGQEVLPESAEHVRIGSFADGMRTLTPVSSPPEERKLPVAA